MASTETEFLDPVATVEKLKTIASGRALNRRHFVAALGVAGAAAGTSWMPGGSMAHPEVVEAAGFAQSDYLNFVLNLKYLQATFYSYITQGTDLPASVTVSSGPITGAPAKMVFTGTNAAQTTDLLNEIYYDELSQVIDLQSLLGSIVVARPAINLAGTGTVAGTVALTPAVALSWARLFEDLSVTALTGMASFLSSTNLTFAAQILAVESFHAGAIRLVNIQAGTPYQATASLTPFTGNTTAGSAAVAALLTTTAGAALPVVGDIVEGTGIPVNTSITAIVGANTTGITGTFASGAKSITAVSSVSGLAIGQIVTATGIPANTTITAIGSTAPFSLTISAATTAAGTAAALTVGTVAVTLSANATASGVVTINVVTADTQDVAPFDPGSASAAASGPSAIPGTSPPVYQGFFGTAGSSSASAPPGFAFTRTVAQVLSILYASSPGGISAAPGTNLGGFFPTGFSGNINGT